VPTIPSRREGFFRADYISLIFQTSLDRLQLKEWVNNTNVHVILAVVEVFCKKFAGTATFRSGQDHGIPERNLPSGLQPYTSLKDRREFSITTHEH
jgi:hypothetical protein